MDLRHAGRSPREEEVNEKPGKVKARGGGSKSDLWKGGILSIYRLTVRFVRWVNYPERSQSFPAPPPPPKSCKHARTGISEREGPEKHSRQSSRHTTLLSSSSIPPLPFPSLPQPLRLRRTISPPNQKSEVCAFSSREPRSPRASQRH